MLYVCKGKVHGKSRTDAKDAVGIQRGLRKIIAAIKVGEGNIKKSMRDQLAELKSDADKHKSIAGGDSSNRYPSKLHRPFSYVQAKTCSHHWRDRFAI
jgi:hypothetical protein